MAKAKKIVTEFKNVEALIEDWFRRHFHHVTPGTPAHAVLKRAKDDLKAILSAAASEQADPPAPAPSADSN